LRAQHQRFDFLCAEHQGRQHEAGAQHIAQAGFAFNMSALCLQRGDVAVQRAQADAQFSGEAGSAHRETVVPQGLQQGEQSFRTRHEALVW
jgi:hypothetical protein